MEIRERIQKIISEYNFSNRAFAIKCGLSQPTFDKQIRGLRSISSDVIMATLQNFPDISAEWLMRGEGNMYKASIQTDSSTDQFDKLMKLVDTIATLQDVVNTKSDTITLLKERIAQLENQLKSR